jgi:hypothetical protein
LKKFIFYKKYAKLKFLKNLILFFSFWPLIYVQYHKKSIKIISKCLLY